MPSVEIKNVSLSFGTVEVLKSLDLEIEQGEFVVLLGPSGCGKSTLLNCIAGLLDVSRGQIFINGRNVTWDEPKDRGIGMVFQSYALYPQMTVEANLSFGLKNAGVPKDEIARRIARAAGILQIDPLLARKPSQLSGGQRQRVAIGRALVRDVEVFLFDEPLSNLDAKLRSELRVEIKRLHQKLSNTMIYVTHDQIEAMTLADRIAIMKGGVIQQLAPPQEVYNHPAYRFVAEFIGSPGMNFIAGTLATSARPVFSSDGLAIDCSRYAFDGAGAMDGAADFGIRPEHVLQGAAAARLPVRLAAEVELVEPMGSDMLVWTKAGSHALTFITDSNEKFAAGQPCQIGFDPARASIFAQASGTRL